MVARDHETLEFSSELRMDRKRTGLRHASNPSPTPAWDHGDHTVVGWRTERVPPGLDGLLASIVEDRRGHPGRPRKPRNGLQEATVLSTPPAEATEPHRDHSQRERERGSRPWMRVGHHHGRVAADDDGMGEHDGRADHHGQMVVPMNNVENSLPTVTKRTDIHAEEHGDEHPEIVGETMFFLINDVWRETLGW